MQIPDIKPRQSLPKSWAFLALAAGIAVFALLIVGMVLAPQYAVYGLAAIGIGIPLFLMVWIRPELGLLALIFLTSSIVPADFIDVRLPIGGGLDMRDLVLLGMFGLLAFRELANKTINIPWWRVGGPLALFLIMAVFSTFYAIIIQNVETNWAFGDFRILISYAMFFMVVWGVKRDDQFQTLLFGLFIIADLTTAIVIAQQFLGAGNPLLEAMTTTQDWRVYQSAGGVVRVVPAGHVLMHFMWFIALGISVFAQLSPRMRGFYTFQIAFIGVGHILTFMRAQWIAMFIGFALMSVVLIPRFRSSISRYLIMGLSIFFVMALLWGIFGLSNLVRIPFVSFVVDRFASILTPDDTLETGSLQWRVFENNKAIEAIQKQPLFGVGLGGRYRPITTFHGEAIGSLSGGSLLSGRISRFTRYVHNSYLSITVKMGIPAMIMLLWFCFSFLLNGWKAFQSTPDLMFKGLILGVLVAFIGLMEWSFYHAHLIKAESVPVIALMVGLVGQIVHTKMMRVERVRSI